MPPPARCSNHRCVYIDQCDKDISQHTLHKIVIVSMHPGVNTSNQFSTVYISQHILHKIVTVSMHLGVNTSTQLSTVHDISENISQHTLYEIVSFNTSLVYVHQLNFLLYTYLNLPCIKSLQFQCFWV